jgi:hypothetical protein
MDVSLCGDCSEFLQSSHHDEFYGDKSWRRFRDSSACERVISRVIQAADRGCNVCKTVVCKFRSLKSDLLVIAQENGDSVIFRVVIEEYHNTNLQWEEDIDRPFLRVSISQEEIKFRLWRVSRIHEAGCGVKDENQSTGSEGSFLKAEKWLRKCIHNHEKCNSVDTLEDWAPSRLLDIGPATNPFPTTIKLRNTKSWQRSVHYITLSHCWGSVQPFRLLRNNLSELIDGISIDTLPKTFQDAIYATWRFGVQYLWIDSLCIIQDSIKDWNVESSLMTQVYGRCLLNLAAIFSNDCTGGLFQNRPPSYLGSRFISVESMTDGFRSYYQLWDQNIWDTSFESARLNTRAWVMQERLLSPRTLGFAEAQLFWECRCNRSSEEFPLGYPSELFERRRDDFPQPGIQDKLKTHSMNHHADSRFEDNHTRRLSLAWHNLIMHYSRNQMTYEQDKLPAISGIASLFAQQLDTDYLAGLWRSTLLSDLLWEANLSDSAMNQPLEYRAPSWSWASVNCAAKYLPGWIESPEVTVIEADAPPIWERSKFGRVSNGYIRLSGKLIHNLTVVPYRGNSHALQASSSESHSKAAECTPDHPLGPADMRPEIFCLPVGSYCDTSWARGNKLYIGLVLVAHEVQRRGHYRRWGIFTSHWGWFDDTDNQPPKHRYINDGDSIIVLN